jgi:hypothetical protein
MKRSYLPRTWDSLKLILLVFSTFSTLANAQIELIGIENDQPYIGIVDPGSGNELDFLFLSGATGPLGNAENFRNATGLAVHPNTNVVYAAMKLCSGCGPGRSLVTIDMETGVTTLVGEMPQPIASLSFRDNGVLYGVTGDCAGGGCGGAATPETLYTVNINDASLSFVQSLGNGDDGEAIAYNSNDGHMYHMSGIGSGLIFEKINLSTGVVTPISMSGAAVGGREAIGFVYDPAQNLFYGSLFDWGGGILSFISITPAGFLTIIAPAEFAWKDYIFYDFSPPPAPAPQFSCSSSSLPIVCSLPDINSDGSPDVGVVRAGSTLAEVRDGQNGALLRSITFFNDSFTPVAAAVLPDSDSNGIAELAVLATRNSDGRIVVEIRNITGAEAPRSVWFAANHAPVAMTSVDDADSNGVVELAVLSRRNSDGRGLVEVKNAFGATNPNALWAGAGLTSTDVEAVPDKDSNGVPEIAILSTRDSDGRIVAEIKNAAGATLPTAVWFAPGHTAIDLTVVADKDANGIPEVAVLSRRDSDGRNVVEIKNASGPTMPSAVWFAPGHTATEVRGLYDVDSNGVPEVAVLSVRDSDSRILVEVKNASGPTLPNALWYSPGFTANGMATIEDTDSDNVDEVLVLMVRDSDGRILVQGRNASGVQAAKNFWFSP